MIRALHASSTGMYAQELYIDMIANNLANVNTTSFKKSRIEFQDLLYETLRAGGTTNNGSTAGPIELQVGHGTKPITIQKNMGQGAITPTYNTLDLAIEGDGFFQITQMDGSIAYTRDGSFKLSADGKVVTSNGQLLEPELTIPQDAANVVIREDGSVLVTINGDTEPQELTQIELARFINSAGLTNIGENLYQANSNSGQPIIGTPGLDGFGQLSQGNLESSNVEVVEEMVNMIAAQRAYEINSKVIKSAQDMLTMANNLIR